MLIRTLGVWTFNKVTLNQIEKAETIGFSLFYLLNLFAKNFMVYEAADFELLTY
jgi:hypothetical protein